MEKLVEIKETIKQKAGSASRKPDRDAQRLLLYVFTGTRGGFTRLQILALLCKRPMNTNNIALETGLDYKAVQHHLCILEKNNLVTKMGQKYGASFYISNYLEANVLALDAVLAKLEQQLNRKIVYL